MTLLYASLWFIIGVFIMLCALIGAGIYGAVLVVRKRRKQAEIDWEDGSYVRFKSYTAGRDFMP